MEKAIVALLDANTVETIILGAVLWERAENVPRRLHSRQRTISYYRGANLTSVGASIHGKYRSTTRILFQRRGVHQPYVKTVPYGDL